MKKILLSLTMFILLVSCKNQNPFTVRHTSITDTFLNKRACDLPCWQNITPGVTSYAEGMNIIKTFNLAKNFELDEVEGSEELGSTFLWDFISLDPSTVANDEGVFRKEGYEDVISSMRFRFPYSWMSLEDFVLLYGEPDRVAFSLNFNTHIPGSKGYLLDLIYDEKNTMVSVYTVEKRSKLMIDENVVIYKITIVEKNLFQEYLLSPSYNIIDWEGYGNYASIKVSPIYQDTESRIYRFIEMNKGEYNPLYHDWLIPLNRSRKVFLYGK